MTAPPQRARLAIPVRYEPIGPDHRDGRNHLVRDAAGVCHLAQFRDGQWRYPGCDALLTDVPVEVAVDA